MLVDFHDYRQNYRMTLSLIEKETIQLFAHVRFKMRPVKLFLIKVFLHHFFNQIGTLLHQLPVGLNENKTARGNLRPRHDLLLFTVNRCHDYKDAVLGQYAAITQHDIADITNPGTINHGIANLDVGP